MSEQQGSQPSGKGRNPTMLAVRVVLLVILVVLLAALLYDRFVAAPKVNQAHEAVEKLMEVSEQASMGERKEPLTDAVVRQEIGEPTQREESGKFVIDRYSWRRGLLFTTYDLYVVYHKDPGGQLVVIDVSKIERPSIESLGLE